MGNSRIRIREGWDLGGWVMVREACLKDSQRQMKEGQNDSEESKEEN